MSIATGIGSMPGTDFAESLRLVMGEVGDFVYVPELPARGVHAGMIGRTLAVLDGLDADLQPDGWRVGVGEGIDQRRARSLLAQDLDVAEELAGTHEGPLKLQVTGPLTLAASVERPRGDKMLADHGARREIAESLAEGLRTHVADARRRFPARGPGRPGRRAVDRRGPHRRHPHGERILPASQRSPTGGRCAAAPRRRRDHRGRGAARGALVRAGRTRRAARRRRLHRDLVRPVAGPSRRRVGRVVREGRRPVARRRPVDRHARASPTRR